MKKCNGTRLGCVKIISRKRELIKLDFFHQSAKRKVNRGRGASDFRPVRSSTKSVRTVISDGYILSLLFLANASWCWHHEGHAILFQVLTHLSIRIYDIMSDKEFGGMCSTAVQECQVRKVLTIYVGSEDLSLPKGMFATLEPILCDILIFTSDGAEDHLRNPTAATCRSCTRQ